MRWAQTDPESCGAAALMVALAEMQIGTIGPEREMQLWESIRVRGPFQGSIPGLIALQARHEGTTPRIWHDPERIREARATLGNVATFDVANLLQQHEQAMAKAREAGVVVEEGLTNPRAMVQAMRDGEALMLGFAVRVPGGVTLHWRLYRFAGDAIWEMDPAGGVEAPKGENQMVEMLTGPSYIGVAVSLKR